MQTHRSPPGLGVRVESWVVAGTGVSVEAPAGDAGVADGGVNITGPACEPA
jgi:hypothetical protein